MIQIDILRRIAGDRVTFSGRADCPHGDLKVYYESLVCVEKSRSVRYRDPSVSLTWIGRVPEDVVETKVRDERDHRADMIQEWQALPGIFAADAKGGPPCLRLRARWIARFGQQPLESQELWSVSVSSHATEGDMVLIPLISRWVVLSITSQHGLSVKAYDERPS